MLKGVGAAAVAAPFASPAAAYAKNSIKGRRAFSVCLNCVTAAHREYVADNRNIKQFFARYGKKPKLTAVQSAALASYLAGNRRAYIQDVNACRTGPACAPSLPPPPPTGTGTTTCPPGTGACPGGGDAIATCCYGGDACCVCANVSGGYICCAGVIGCTCC
jgi:hypothetical protein